MKNNKKASPKIFLKRISQIIGAGMVALGLATAKPVAAQDGLFIKPEASVIFLPSKFSHGVNKTAYGGGADLNVGYQFDAWSWDVVVAYYYQASKNNTIKNVGKVDVKQSFIPIYTGINYSFPFLSSIDTTVGLGVGAMINMVDNKFTRISGTAFNDKATVVTLLLVPKVQLDYIFTDQWSLTLAGKFYLMFDGYNDFYSKEAKRATGSKAKDELGWFGTFSLGALYRF